MNERKKVEHFQPVLCDESRHLGVEDSKYFRMIVAALSEVFLDDFNGPVTSVISLSCDKIYVMGPC